MRIFLRLLRSIVLGAPLSVLLILTPTVWGGALFTAPTDAESVEEAPPQADPDRENFTLTLLMDNDGGVFKRNHPTDRHYTNGTALSLTVRPQWADDLAHDLYGSAHAQTRDTAAGFFFGQLMFTPADTTASHLLENDRPYAGYLFGGAFWQRADRHTLDHVRLELGVVGPASQADHTQVEVHEMSGGELPNGWDNQLEDEVTVQGFYQRKWKLMDEQLGTGDWPVEVELLPDVGVALGTAYRHVEVGATLRIGWQLPDDFGPARMDDLSGTAGRFEPGWGIYGFARAAGRAVEHNIFLEGNTFKDSHSVDEERLLGRVQAGVRLYYRTGPWRAQLGYDQTFLTPEFEQQSGGDAFASVTLGISGQF